MGGGEWQEMGRMASGSWGTWGPRWGSRPLFSREQEGVRGSKREGALNLTLVYVSGVPTVG